MHDSQPSLILVDAHVHLHHCFSLQTVLDSALQNFQDNFQHMTTGLQYPLGVLFINEIGSQNSFAQLRADISSKQAVILDDWTLKITPEQESLVAQHSSGQQILLIVGRQIVTSENIEVLSLFSSKTIPEQQSLEKTLLNVSTAEGLAVLPWGFGKWFGKRGKLVNQMIQARDQTEILIGDNGNRPSFWINPVYLNKAKRKGIKVLPGTDPLPLAAEVHRPGSFGFYTQGIIQANRPAACLKQILIDPNISLQPYGSLETPFRFINNQIQFRLQKKKSKAVE